MFFESWQELLRIVITILLLYPILIFLTHILGMRSFAKMNNFDWIVTVAIGAILGSSILSKTIVITESLLAIILLLICQWALTFTTSRSDRLNSLLKTSPSLLFYQGEYLRRAMLKERVTLCEIESAVRKASFADDSEVLAVVFEPDGELSVIGKGGVKTNLLNTVISD